MKKQSVPKKEEAQDPGWWHTIPGMLTAVAGIITATGAFIAALHQAGLLRVWISPLGPSVKPIHHLLRSEPGVQPSTEVNFVNSSGQEIEIFWIDTSGTEKSFGRIPSGESRNQSTYATHPWLIKDAATGEHLLVVVPKNTHRGAVTIDVTHVSTE